MAIAWPIDFGMRKLRDEIQAIYARVATDPSLNFTFTGDLSTRPTS